MTTRIHVPRFKLRVLCGTLCVLCGKKQPYRKGHKEKATQRTQS